MHVCQCTGRSICKRPCKTHTYINPRAPCRDIASIYNVERGSKILTIVTERGEGLPSAQKKFFKFKPEKSDSVAL